jgi:hypothetical protein
MRRQRLLWWALGGLVALSAGAALIVYLYWGNLFDPMERGRRVVASDYVGRTKASVTEEYGPPTREWNGCYGKPPPNYLKLHGQAVTLIYERFTGTLYLSFDPVDDEWVCFSSHWVPNGIALD